MDILEPLEKEFISYRNDTIEKWSSKVQLANGIPLDKKFKVINQSIVSQLEQSKTDRERLVKRTQLKRSDYKILGKTVTPVSLNEDLNSSKDSHLNEYDPEIFDDGDFYQQLLKEFIESRMSGSEDQLLSLKYNLKQKEISVK